jgi:hypothetical protein
MLRGRYAAMPPEAAAALKHFPEPLCPGDQQAALCLLRCMVALYTTATQQDWLP